MRDRRIDPDPALVDGHRPAQIARPVVDLLARPKGARDRQLLLGADVTVLGATGNAAYVRSDHDGYVGFVDPAALADRATASHTVTARATHAYSQPDIKSPEAMALSLGSRLTATGESRDFVETAFGHVPKVHLAALPHRETDPAGVAERLLGTPYLWGGNSAFGIDCSGLIQIALLACGIPCPGDSDQQQAAFGDALPAGSPLEHGDLLFWKGHVAMAADAATLVHANAYHMAVVHEDSQAAIDRIQLAEGPVLAHKRPSSG